MFYNKYFSGGTNTSSSSRGNLSTTLPTVLPSSSSSRDLNSSSNLVRLEKEKLAQKFADSADSSGIATNPYGLGGLSVARSLRPGGFGTRERSYSDPTRAAVNVDDTLSKPQLLEAKFCMRTFECSVIGLKSYSNDTRTGTPRYQVSANGVLSSAPNSSSDSADQGMQKQQVKHATIGSNKSSSIKNLDFSAKGGGGRKVNMLSALSEEGNVSTSPGQKDACDPTEVYDPTEFYCDTSVEQDRDMLRMESITNYPGKYDKDSSKGPTADVFEIQCDSSMNGTGIRDNNTGKMDGFTEYTDDNAPLQPMCTTLRYSLVNGFDHVSDILEDLSFHAFLLCDGLVVRTGLRADSVVLSFITIKFQYTHHINSTYTSRPRVNRWVIAQ